MCCGESGQGSKGAGGADLIFSCSSGSSAVGLMLAFCSKMAQQSGVAKVRTRPTRATWGEGRVRWLCQTRGVLNHFVKFIT